MGDRITIYWLDDESMSEQKIATQEDEFLDMLRISITGMSDGESKDISVKKEIMTTRKYLGLPELDS